MNKESGRVSTGVSWLDSCLGGGLLPGTLTVVVGATGIGKSQLGIQFVHASNKAAGDEPQTNQLPRISTPGVIVDFCSRGDSQAHHQYAERLCQTSLQAINPSDVSNQQVLPRILNAFPVLGTRLNRGEMEPHEWDERQAELNRNLVGMIGFLYRHFCNGVNRIVMDGLEPIQANEESIQYELFEYLLNQVLRKEAEWVARDFYRERFLEMSKEVEKHHYSVEQITSMALLTSSEANLDRLMDQPLDGSGLMANANTLIYMGKTRTENRIGRALYIAKHRGSSCSEEIIPFRIDEQGLQEL